jgi:hypothetical protein
MLRHTCGFKLANDGVDTRALQHFMGHRNIMHTVRDIPSSAPTASMGSGRIEPRDASNKPDFTVKAVAGWPSSPIRVCHGPSIASCLSLLKTSPTAGTVVVSAQ